jgi:PAS domain S-box-containing protein
MSILWKPDGRRNMPVLSSRQRRLALPLAMVVTLCLWLAYYGGTYPTPYRLMELVTLFSTGASLFLWGGLSTANKQLRAAQRKMKAAELRFDKIYNSGIIGLWFTDHDGTIVQANDAFLDIIGYTRDDLANGHLNRLRLTPPEFTKITERQADQLMETGYCPPYEKEYIRKDGSRVAVMLGASLLPEGDLADIVAYAVDITELKAAKKREQGATRQMLQKREEMLRIFMDAPACIVLRKGPDLKITFANNAAIAQNALGRASIEGAATADLFKKVKTNFDISILHEVYRTGESYRRQAVPLRFDRNGDGTVTDAWYDIVMEPTFDEEGNVDGVATYSFDVSELVRANEQLQKSETRFRFIADAIPHKMWTSAADGTATYYNQGWYNYTGTSTLEELREMVWGSIHPQDLKRTAAAWNKAIATSEDMEIEHRLRRHDGLYLWHLSRVCVHKDESGKAKLWVGTCTNIHEQKVALEALAASENHFRALTNHTSLLIWQTDAHCRMTYVNDTWRAYTGVTHQEITEADWLLNIHPDDREEAETQFNQAFSQRVGIQIKYRFCDRRNDGYRWMLDHAQPVFDPDFQGYIGSMTDIHEQEIAEISARLVMAKKDQFFDIATHELKTPVTTMKASLQVLTRLLEQETQVTNTLPFVGQANKQVNKLTAILNDLLDINRIQAGKLVLERTAYFFNESLAECISYMRQQRPDILVEMSDIQPVTIWADRIRIEQVLVNLLSNAFKYSSQGKSIRVAVFASEGLIKVAVTDQGIGISPEKQPFVFDRFFRVHENSQHYAGLGMGLFISAEIVRKHGGEIGVQSQEEKGSTFWFSIPIGC